MGIAPPVSPVPSDFVAPLSHAAMASVHAIRTPIRGLIDSRMFNSRRSDKKRAAATASASPGPAIVDVPRVQSRRRFIERDIDAQVFSGGTLKCANRIEQGGRNLVHGR